MNEEKKMKKFVPHQRCNKDCLHYNSWIYQLFKADKVEQRIREKNVSTKSLFFSFQQLSLDIKYSFKKKIIVIFKNLYPQLKYFENVLEFCSIILIQSTRCIQVSR